MFERECARDQLSVAVIQPRHDGRAVGIKHNRLSAAKPLHVAVRADTEDLVAADGNSFLEVGATTGIHLAVDDDEINRAACIVTLGTDNQSRDESRPDDDGNQDARKARRHFREYSVASRPLLEEDER